MAILDELLKALREEISVDLFIGEEMPYENCLITEVTKDYVSFNTAVNNMGFSKIYKYTVKIKSINCIGYAVASIESDDDDMEEIEDMFFM